MLVFQNKLTQYLPKETQKTKPFPVCVHPYLTAFYANIRLVFLVISKGGTAYVACIITQSHGQVQKVQTGQVTRQSFTYRLPEQ